MNRRRVAIIGILLIAGLFLFGPTQGWQFISTVFSADLAWGKKSSGAPEVVWIRRSTFQDSVRRYPARSAQHEVVTGLPNDIDAQLRQLGALKLVILPSADIVCCSCQVEVPGTQYLRRFECTGATTDAASRGLLVQVQNWISARRR